MKYVIEFFQPKEFICPCCKRGRVAVSLVYFLDELRRAWDAPILINSGYRCARHNYEVGGSPVSRHLIGCAADIRPKDPELIVPFQYLVGRMAGRRTGWELRLYDRFVHVAVPRSESSYLWDGGPVTIELE